MPLPFYGVGSDKDAIRQKFINLWDTRPSLDELDVGISSVSQGSGVPQLALLPMALKSPKFLAALSKRLNIPLDKAIKAVRYQREATLKESHPGRGAWFFTPEELTHASGLYRSGQFSGAAPSGGNVKILEELKVKNPFLASGTGLRDALEKLLGNNPDQIQKEWKKLPNNIRKQVISHIGYDGSEFSHIMQERVASELLKKYGYDSVLSSSRNPYDRHAVDTIVKLRMKE